MNTYEVSTQGDRRFSAFVARLRDGRTIEEAYQLDIKGYRSFSDDVKYGKGKLPLFLGDITRSTKTGYQARTIENATESDMTLAFAIDYTSAGERLTERVAREHSSYHRIPLDSRASFEEKTGEFLKWLSERERVILNIAGNGLYTFKKKHVDWTQDAVNRALYSFFFLVAQAGMLNRILLVRSGGQTGADEAGVVVANLWGLQTRVHAPLDWRFRDEAGNDFFGEKLFKERFMPHRVKQLYIRAYHQLWMKFAWENPMLIEDLRKCANGRQLSDMFAHDRLPNQAASLTKILEKLPTQDTPVCMRRSFVSHFARSTSSQVLTAVTGYPIELLNVNRLTSSQVPSGATLLYCGRASSFRAAEEKTGLKMADYSYLGNPFHEGSRDEVCNAFGEHFAKNYEKYESMIKHMNRLHKSGPIYLVCFCAPERCHTETIRKAILELDNELPFDKPEKLCY